MKWIGGIIAAIITSVVVWHLTEGLRKPSPIVVNTPPPTIINDNTPSQRELVVKMKAQSPKPGGPTQVSVEVLSGPSSPVPGATVQLSVGGGSFTSSGGLEVVGTTNKFGFFASEWRSPPMSHSGQRYLIAAVVDAPGYRQKTKRLNLTIH